MPLMRRRALAIGDFRALLKDLDGKILPDGTVSDHASVALGRLRRDIERQKKAIQDSLERFLRSHREEGILQEEFVTIRNERFVVPVIAGQRRKLDGVLHGADVACCSRRADALAGVRQERTHHQSDDRDEDS